MDEQGGVVLSAHIRKAIGIKGRGRLLIGRDGLRIVLEPFTENLVNVLMSGLI